MKLSCGLLAAVAAAALGFIAFLYVVDAARARADVLHVHMDDAEITRRIMGTSSRADAEQFLFDARIQRGPFNTTDRTIYCVLFEHDRMPFVARTPNIGLVLSFDGDDKLTGVRIDH